MGKSRQFLEIPCWRIGILTQYSIRSTILEAILCFQEVGKMLRLQLSQIPNDCVQRKMFSLPWGRQASHCNHDCKMMEFDSELQDLVCALKSRLDESGGVKGKAKDG